MYKVVIADDEKKVCQLIYMLVDWKSLDMEVVGVVNNGYEVLEKVREYSPDIIITDIRMPGLNGLDMIKEVSKNDNKPEFIIISGYREFQYAQTAVHYGVNQYLLKPIKKEELFGTLQALREKFQRKNERISKEESLKKSLEDNKSKIQKGLFTEVLLKGGFRKRNLTLDSVNEEYKYAFKEGSFLVVCIKLDHTDRVYNNNTQILEEKSNHLIREGLSNLCYDMGVLYMNGVVYCVLNYEKDKITSLKKQIKSLLNDGILQDVIYQQLDATVGVGLPVDYIDGIFESFRQAEYAYQQRLLNGTSKVLEYPQQYKGSLADSQVFIDFNKSFIFNVNNLNLDGIVKDIQLLKKNLLDRTETTGHEILQMTKEVCNLYMLCMRTNNLNVKNEDNFVREYSIYADECNSIQELFKHLKDTVCDSISEIIEDRKQETTKPIRIAKQYVEENYMKSVTIEEIGTKVGFSSNHFSTIFKKETGVTFLEYLSSVRMKHAKDLLKEGNMSIAVICEEVGYSDVKYFTKSFHKHTGLKPNEYRKLYS